jgi:hypothetical protein
MAAAFPQKVTEEDKKGFKDFLNLLYILYNIVLNYILVRYVGLILRNFLGIIRLKLVLEKI